MNPNNIDLWTVLFHYHWNWVAVLVVLLIASTVGIIGGKSS